MSRQELYRFIYSFSILKYLPLLSGVLLVLCYMNILFSGSEEKSVRATQAWSELGTCFAYTLLMIIVAVSVYIGREIKNKTLNYEIMKGRSTFRISLDKTVSCGVFIPIIVTVCFMVYLFIFHAIADKQDLFRLLLIMLVLSHIVSAALMFILICKNAVIGAVIAFAKFALMESMFSEVTKNIVSEHVHQMINNMCIFVQIENITIKNAGTSMVEVLLYVIISFAIEYLLLQCVYYVSANYLLEPGV